MLFIALISHYFNTLFLIYFMSVNSICFALNKIKNAQAAGHSFVLLPNSNMLFSF